MGPPALAPAPHSPAGGPVVPAPDWAGRPAPPWGPPTWAIPGLRGAPLRYCEPATPSIRSVVPALASKTVREARSAQAQTLNERRQSLRLAAADLVRRTRIEQDLPPTIIDLQALHRVAVLLSGTSKDGDGHIRPPSTADDPERQVGAGRLTFGKGPSDHIDADTAHNGCRQEQRGRWQCGARPE
jgi:hypothetical protein